MIPFIQACYAIWLELSPWLLLGLVAAGLLHVLAPAEWIRHHLGREGVHSIWKAVLIGTPMPLCSCGVIPAAIGLRRDGASKGASLAFLISTPQTGIDSISVSAAFLGLPFALFKVFSAVVTGLLGGWLAERFDSGDDEPAAAAHCADEAESGGRRTWRDGVAQADMLLQMIGLWLVIGVAVSALITVTMGTGGLAEIGWTQGIGGMLLMLVISLPLYVCATASVPIAAALVSAGLPGGTALVFLMAGPATNVATIGAVYRAFGRRMTAIYLGTVGLGSIALGMLFDTFWGVTVSSHAAHLHEHAPGVIATVSGAVVALAVLRHGWLWLRSRLVATAKPAINEQVLQVSGMTCGGCAAKLKRQLQQVPGVTAVQADAASGRVVVQGTAEGGPIAEAVRAAGFRVVPSGI